MNENENILLKYIFLYGIRVVVLTTMDDRNNSATSTGDSTKAVSININYISHSSSESNQSL